MASARLGGKHATDVPVDPLRTRFEELREQGIRGADIARRLGWRDHRGQADSGRVHRVLGLRPVPRRDGPPKIQTYVSVQTAQQMAQVLGLDPWEVGL